MALTKNSLVEMVCNNAGYTKQESAQLVESVFTLIKEELAGGHDVMISGFGKWLVKSKRERRGRNPQTGETITIGAKKVVTFYPSQILRGRF